DAVIGDNAYRMPVNASKPGYQGRAIVFFELMEAPGVNRTGNNFSYIEGRMLVFGNYSGYAGWIICWCYSVKFRPDALRRWGSRCNDVTHDRQSVHVIFCNVVGYSRNRRMHFGAPKFFGCHDLSGSSFNQRWTT